MVPILSSKELIANFVGSMSFSTRRAYFFDIDSGTTVVYQHDSDEKEVTGMTFVTGKSMRRVMLTFKGYVIDESTDENEIVMASAKLLDTIENLNKYFPNIGEVQITHRTNKLLVGLEGEDLKPKE